MIKKMYKKIFIILCIVFMMLSLLSCAKKNKHIGSGEVGKTAEIEWSEFDEMIKKIKNMTASKERDLLMHKAEEMAMSLYCVIPINTIRIPALCKDNLHGIYMDIRSAIHLENMYFDDNRKTANIQIGYEPTTLNPDISSDNVSDYYITNMYGTLVKYDENGKLVYHYLDNYKLSDDELTYTFTLKDNLKWSDGVPLTSSDFVYTLKRHANPTTGGQLSYVLSSIKGYPRNLDADIIDDKTFYIKVNTPCPYFLSIFTNALAAPIRKDIVENDKDWFLKTPTITAGPYILKEWIHKESMVLEKNPYYFDKDNVKLDKINLMLNNNSTSIYNAFKTDDLDYAITIPKDLKNDNVISYRTIGMQFLRFNTKNKLFAGMTVDEAIKFRKAISYCIDRDFIEKIGSERIEKSYTFINNAFVGSNGESFLQNTKDYTYPYKNGYMEDINLDKARDLLKEIGYHFDKKGKIIEDVAFELLTGKANYDYMTIIQTDLRKIGISAKIRKLDNAYLPMGNYCVSFSGWFADYYDPVAMLELFESTNDNNTSFINKPLP